MPGELPVQVLSKYDLVVNFKVARRSVSQYGSRSLAQADEVSE